MSLSQAVVCDGCGETVQAIRMAGGQRYMLPTGWLRMQVYGRAGDHVSRLGEVEIHHPDCATFALKQFFDKIAPEEQ